MTISLRLIRIRPIVYLFRGINILLVFLPLTFLGTIDTEFEIGLWRIWSLVFITLFILQMRYIKRYSKIGRLEINDTSIRVNHENSTWKEYDLSVVQKGSIKYTGYRGEPLSNYFLVLPWYSREGIGQIELFSNNEQLKYYFVAEKDCSARIRNLRDLYSQKGFSIEFDIPTS